MDELCVYFLYIFVVYQNANNTHYSRYKKKMQQKKSFNNGLFIHSLIA